MNIINYLRYSGINVTILLNPFGWNYMPKYMRETDPWGDNDHIFCFLFVSVRIFLSDGDW